MNKDVDPALVERAKQGDRIAFRAIVDAYKDRMYQLALGHLRDHHDAEDALQEAFVKAYRALPGFRGESGLGTWLYRITVNSCLDLQRRRQPEVELTQSVLELQVTNDPCDDPQRIVASRDLGHGIDRAVARLTPLERSVFVLRHYGELPLREVARTLDRREGTVKGMLFRALRKLRRDLEPYRDSRVTEPR